LLCSYCVASQGSLLPSLTSLHSRSFHLDQRRLEALKRLEQAIQVRCTHISLLDVWSCVHVSTHCSPLVLQPALPLKQKPAVESSQFVACHSGWAPCRCYMHHPISSYSLNALCENDIIVRVPRGVRAAVHRCSITNTAKSSCIAQLQLSLSEACAASALDRRLSHDS
jgi:hypothetical protein